MESVEVIVVGAGASGLAAAGELVRAGRSVVVLEAAGRVGGRLKAGVVGGRVVDFGGQWVGARHTTLLEEAGRHGIETYKQYEAGRTVMQLDGKTVSFAGDTPKMPLLSLLELARLQAGWDKDMATLAAEAPWTAPRAREWDGQTLESWILRHVHTAAAREFARLVPRGAWACEASQVSYLWFLDALRAGEGLAHLMAVGGGVLDAKFKGGMHQVAAAMARELGDRVILDAPVSRIGQDEGGVVVTTARGDFSARHTIVAIPPGPAGRIDYAPHLPSARDGLHQRMPMGTIVKLAVAYRTPFWREQGFSGQIATDDDMLGIVMEDTQDEGPAMLLGFIEGRHALELSAAGKAEREARTIASLVRFFGPAAGDYLAYDDNDWTLDPWAHGYVGHMPPGVMTRFGHALREPCGRIHWAGTETAVEWAGYIEGALRAGRRAAAEVAAPQRVSGAPNRS